VKARAWLAALTFVALAAGAAFASSTTTEQPTVYMILLPDDSVEKGKVWPKTEDECVTRARALSGSCSIRRKFVTTTTCADEKAPKLYLAKVMIDGKEYWDLPGASFTEDTYIEMANLYVHAATWPGGYPNCWVRGQAPRDDWRLNSKDEPGKAFMEIRTPDMPAGDLVAEEPNDEKPMPQSAEYQAWWHSPEAEADRHLHHLCNDDDETPCPTLPAVPSACGDYRSVECGGPGV
jgi:hypothetical protein